MKRLRSALVIAVTLALVLSLCACGGSTAIGKSEKTLYDHGLELAVQLDEMVGSEAYMQLYTASEEIAAITQPLAEEDYSTPEAVYQITASEDGQQMMAMLTEMVDLDGLSEELRAIVERKMFGALATQINALAGSMTLAASSVCTAGKTFVNSEITEPTIYLYTYGDAVPVMVSFAPGEDNTVFASATFILYTGFTCGSAEELAAFFADTGVNVTEVTAE